jgi:hypothetical protein
MHAQAQPQKMQAKKKQSFFKKKVLEKSVGKSIGKSIGKFKKKLSMPPNFFHVIMNVQMSSHHNLGFRFFA